MDIVAIHHPSPLGRRGLLFLGRYRTLTYGILKEKIDFHQPDQLQQFLSAFLDKFDIKIIQRERRYFYNGKEVSHVIRGKKR